MTKLLAKHLRNEGCVLQDGGTVHHDRRNGAAGHVVFTVNEQRHKCCAQVDFLFRKSETPPLIDLLHPHQCGSFLLS